MSIEGAVDRALGRAIAWLERRQHPSGELPSLFWGQPDQAVFPTALAAHALSFAPGAAAIRARALAFLAAEVDEWGLWRHRSRVHAHWQQIPPDLDDTSCCSAALALGGWPVPDNRGLLLSNRDRRGLFYTWKFTSAQFRHPLLLASFFWQTPARPFDLDAVVNANVLHYLGLIPETRPVIEYLLEVIRDEREAECDKWYYSRFVVWYFFSRALHPFAPQAGEIIVSRIARATPADPLERAMAACSLLYWNRVPDIDGVVSAQLESGGWPSAPLYHSGRLRQRDGTYATPYPDAPYWASEELTTVFCIEALSRWRGAPRP